MPYQPDQKTPPTFRVTDTRNNVTKSLADKSTRTVNKDDLLRKEQETRFEMDVEAHNVYRKIEAEFSRARLFISRRARDAALSARSARVSSDAVHPILQEVVYGQENKVRDMLEAVKNDIAQLSVLLTHTSTVTDYSNRTITGMTLLQAAAAAGDSDMCLMLKKYFDLIPNGQQAFSTQLAEIFPEGIEAHEKKQKQNCFSFDKVCYAIHTARLKDIEAALGEEGKLSKRSALYLALEEFRREFAEISCSEKIFNPHHLLRAYELLAQFASQFETHNWDDQKRIYFKRGELFFDLIIGYIQRFVPSCYAQAFAQHLDCLVKTNYQPESWCAEPFKRDFTIRNTKFSYFPLRDEEGYRLGFDFGIGQQNGGWRYERYAERFIEGFVAQKQQAFETMLSGCHDDQCRSSVTP